MIQRVALFLVGLIFGSGAMLLDQRIDEGGAGQNESKPIVQQEDRLLFDSNSFDARSTTIAPIPPQAPDNETPVIRDAALPAKIPRAYRELLNSSRRPLMYEAHRRFASEPRDDAWAFAMEAGISQYIERNLSDSGFVTEYIECRSSFCEVAGVSQYASENELGADPEFGSLTDQHWWDGSKPIFRIGNHTGGLSRYVIIFSRYGREAL